MPSRSASSSSVACRIDPVKCRCRWAFGSGVIAAALPPVGEGAVRDAVGAAAPVSTPAATPGSAEQLLQPGDALDEVVVAECVGQAQVAG